jgi:histone H3/H4
LEGKWTERPDFGIRGQPFRKLISFYCAQKAPGLRFAHKVMRVLQTGIEQRIIQYMMQAAIMAIGARRHTVNDNDIEAVSSLELAENGDTKALEKYIKVMNKAEEKRAKKAAASKAANATNTAKNGGSNSDGKADEASDKPAKMKAVRAAKKAKTAASAASAAVDGLPPLTAAAPAVAV